MQKPVKISQVLTTPAESLEITIPSFVCRVTDLIEADASGTSSELVVTGSVSGALICQKLIDPSSDKKMRDKENVRNQMQSCVMKVSIR